MSKQGSTKEKIVKLISEGNNTLSDISRQLELAPSTVSKHLDDLEYSGVIEQKDNSHIRKWKYYQVSSNTQTNGQQPTSQDRWFGLNRDRPAWVGAVGVVLIAVVLSLYVYLQGAGSSNYVPIGITDPPTVPAGTEALYINYSSVSVHVNNAGSSQWIAVNSSGRLDLMGLVNESQIIGGIKLTTNSTVDSMRFNITAANIVIDNVSYPVQLTTRQVTARVTSSGAVNSSSGILLDFSPVVTPIYTQNATTYLMVPSLRAEVISSSCFGPNQNQGNYAQPQKYPLPQRYRGDFPGANKNLTISNATFYLNGNQISFSATLSNSGNGNVTVMGIMVNQDRKIMFMPSANASNIDTDANIVRRMPWNQGSVIPTQGAGTPSRTANFKQTGFGQEQAFGAGLGFAVYANGTISPSMLGMRMPQHPSQYTLYAHSSETFKYSGDPYRNGFPQMPSLNQSAYQVLIVTDHGLVSANVTLT